MSYIPLSVAVPDAFWPAALFEKDEVGFLDKLSLEAYEERASDSGFEVYVLAKVKIGASLHLPFLQGVSFDFGEFAGPDAGTIELSVRVESVENGPPEVTVTLTANTLALGFAPGVLQPVNLVPDGDELRIVPVPGKVSIPLPFEVTLAYDGSDWDMSIDLGASSLSLPKCMIGDTGVVIEATGMSFNFSGTGANKPAAAPVGWKGLYFDAVKLWVPRLFNGEIDATGLGIGTGGLYGKVGGNFPVTYDASAMPKYSGALAGNVLGFEGAISDLALEFAHNALVEFEIKARIFLPFLDHDLGVKVATDLQGELSIAVDSDDGLASLSVPNVLDMELTSLGFDNRDRKASVTLGGSLTPTFGSFNWPSFRVKELGIDTQGHLSFDGGWIDLPEQYSFDFNGFKMEITKFGMGRNDDGTKWVGMSGGVELVKGLPAGASVEGLRITANDDWSSPKISFDGIGVALTIPEVLQFKGEVSYREFDDPNPPHAKVRRFDGDITLRLDAIDLVIDGTLVAGSADGYNFLALYVDVELPTGIPFGPSGLAFYGFAGLMALQMRPDKQPAEPWYGAGSIDGWYDKSPLGIEKIGEKWTNADGNKAFAAGVSFGTLADNGYTINGRLLLAVILPGPVVMLQGSANLLKDRTTLDDDAMFRTLAVFDKPAGSILLGVDAEYDYPESSGKLISIIGGLEAYYSYLNQSDWHLYLGLKSPRESRIQARVLSLFDAEAYFMLDPDKLELGSWIGYSKHWQFSKLSVTLEAWMESNAVVGFKPLHLSGSLFVHGSVQLKVFNYGLGLTVDARIAAEVFTPKHLLGEFQVTINLPKPLKDLRADVRLEWGPEPLVPPTPIVLKDVAIEHLKSSTVWPLPAGNLLVPNYNDNGFLKSNVTSAGDDLTPADLLAQGKQCPQVPMDCRPSIAFARNVWDDALLGTLPQPPDPQWEQIGNPEANVGPARVRYGVGAVYLQRYDDGWQTVATANGDPAVDPRLFGTWQVTSGIGGAGPPQNKMLLWSTSGLDQYRNSSADVSVGAIKLGGLYPCPVMPEPTHRCLDFGQIQLFTNYSSPYVHPDNDEVQLMVSEPLPAGGGTPPSGDRLNQDLWTTAPSGYFNGRLGTVSTGVAGQFPVLTKQICPVPRGGILISFGQPVSDLTITATGQSPLSAYALNAAGAQSGPYPFVDDMATIPVANVHAISLVSGGDLFLAKICATFPPSLELVDTIDRMIQHNANANSHWYDTGAVLEPFSDYRLRIDTSIRQKACDGSYDTTYDQTQFAYFRTSGPPGLGSLSVPIDGDAVNFDSGLDDLRRYVRQTIPPTVPVGDGPPLSPRPVYCGYDVGVDFTENYVSLMYRMAGRDLSLILYDRNNLPLRDSGGSLVASENPWDVQPTTSQSYYDGVWTSTIAAGTCLPVFDGTLLPHDERMALHAELAPDMRYEARLVPTLIHEDFGRFGIGASAVGPGGLLGRWHVLDSTAATGGPSVWKIRLAPNGSAQRVEQQAPLASPQPQPAPAGTMLVLGDFGGLPAADPSQPAHWSDYRAGLDMRPGTGSVGIAFRFIDAGTHYVVLLGSGSTIRLVRVSGGAQTLLVQDSFAFNATQDYHVVIEAIGANIRVSIDGILLIEWADTLQPPLALGGVALYASGGKDAAFADLRVHDFSDAARSAYKFSFTSSAYLNFFHHMHSFHDGCWRVVGSAVPPMSDADFAAHVQHAVSDIAGPVSETEALAFEALAYNLLGTQANQDAAQLEVTRVERATLTAAMLVRGPQPFGFARNDCQLLCSATETPVAISPLELKLVGAAMGANAAADEFITILLGEGIDPSGYTVEIRDYSGLPQGDPLPLDPLDDPASVWTTLFVFAQGSGARPRGHQLRVYSCAPFSPAQPEPRTSLYFRAAAGQAGTLDLGGEAVDLRIRAPDGSVIHARRFLKDSAYAPVPVKVLRKRDQTAFLLFPASGAPFAVGSYRLGMQYRRDNSALEPEAVVLSQSGDTGIERAVLDFAWQPFV